MNKQALIEKISDKVGISKTDADKAVETLLDSIVATLKSGQEVSIAGLGIFAVITRGARQARNPRTGESISVPPMRVPKFRASKALKDAVK